MTAIMITFCLLMFIAFTFYSEVLIPKVVKDYCDEDIFEYELTEYFLEYTINDQ